jgi:DNA-binding CsgD family transcriptional regulator
VTENLLATALEIVNKSPLAAVVLELPSERILAASPSATDMLSSVSRPVIGRTMAEFTKEPSTGGTDLLLTGRINGYETVRTLPTESGDVVLRAWVRGVAGEKSPFALAVFWPGLRQPDTLLPELAGEADLPVCVGSSDADLVVDKICADAAALFQRPASEIIGHSLLRLVVPADTASLMFGVAESVRSTAGVSVRVRIARSKDEPVWCQLLLTPLLPPPSLAFTIISDRDEQDLAGGAGEAERLLWRLGSGMEATAMSTDLAATDRRRAGHLSRLTTRELDIVCRLLAGDRVPAIATALYLSQSTIRNHLSAVFRKLKVSSQQGLLDLLREPDQVGGGRHRG